ncbi:Tetratricopeptide repeat-containing protein [Aureimonas jatrophae]|uniref:Tetratricopeptide repeat-containing protein n=1 Tax=Aureimonas jatrophae TaxID=1166073 RepID=A0A1H0IGQ8_9HYPH|nr:Tetratricopeptide repeat-containing protein [Aureimonas jatrophae]
MRAFSFVFAACLVAGPPVQAQTPGSPSPPPGPVEVAPVLPEPEPSRRERLDTLFAELKREPETDKAKTIADRIQALWSQSDSATVDLLMDRSATAIGKKDEAAALDLLDQVIVLEPDYAEGWNRRATLHYAANRYGASMRDVEEVLKREPRHFGALMGLGAMQEELGRNRQALDTFSRALSVYPALKAAQDAVLRISDELAGQPA